MKNIGSHKEKLTSKKIGISAVTMLISTIVLFAVIGIFQNISLAQAQDQNALPVTNSVSKTSNDNCVVTFTCNEGGYLEIGDKDHQPVESLTVPSGSTWSVHLDYDWYELSIYNNGEYMGSAFPYPDKEHNYVVSGWNVQETGVINKDMEFRLLFEHRSHIDYKWDSSLGSVNSKSGSPYLFRDGTIITRTENNKLTITDRDIKDEISAYPYEHCSFDGWYIDGEHLQLNKSYILHKDVVIHANFYKTLVTVDFRIPIVQQRFGHILVDGQSSSSASVKVGWGSGYVINGSTITFNTDGHTVKAQPYFGSDAVFNGWYDMAGNRLKDGAGIVPGSTIIYAHFAKAGIITGRCYDASDKSIVQANVSFYTSDKSLIDTVKTDDEGNYTIIVPYGIVGYLIGIESGDHPTHWSARTNNFTVEESQQRDLWFSKVEGECILFGYVTDSQTNEPIANANVAWYTDDETKPKSTNTDMFGLYCFAVDHKAEGYLFVSASGYQWDFKAVSGSQTSGQNCQIDFELSGEPDTNVYFICDTSDVNYEISYSHGGKVFTYTTDKSFAIGMEYGEMNVLDNSLSFIAHATKNDGEVYYKITAKSKSGKRFVNWTYNSQDVKNHSVIELSDDCVFGTKWLEQCKVYGHVKKSDGTPLENVDVMYVTYDSQIAAYSKSVAGGSFEINVDFNSQGTLWFYYVDGDNYYYSSKVINDTDTDKPSFNAGTISMLQVVPEGHAYVFGRVIDIVSEEPIPGAVVQLRYSNKTCTVLTNNVGMFFMDIEISEETDFSIAVYALGYEGVGLPVDKLKPENIYSVEVKLSPYSEEERILFNVAEHVKSYEVSYYFNEKLVFEHTYVDDFDFPVPNENYYYEFDETGYKIIVQCAVSEDPVKLKYEITLNPEEGYQLQSWDIRKVEDRLNAPITSDLSFTPILATSPSPEDERGFTLIGGLGHAGFTWTYFENEFPVDWGWDFAIDSQIYPYTYVWVDEDGSITTTKYHEETDWPYFGVAKTVVQTHAQDGYEFDYLTVNGQVVEKNSGFYVQDFDWGLFAVAHYKYSEQPDPPGPVPPDPPYPPEPVPPAPGPTPDNPGGDITPTADFTWGLVVTLFVAMLLAGALVFVTNSSRLKIKKLQTNLIIEKR